MSAKTPTKMTDLFGWEDLPAALEVAVFEICGEGRFQPVGNLPDWFAGFEPAPSASGSIDLADRFPVLELFLTDHGAAWESDGQARVTSDIWTDVDDHGIEHYLQAA